MTRPHTKWLSADVPGRALAVTRCQCGKLAYPSKADAKRAARQQRAVAKLTPYRHGSLWHLTGQDYQTRLRHRTKERA